MKSKFLITGIAGFVGHYFIEYLKENNIDAQILGIDILDEFKINFPDAEYKKIDLKSKNDIYNLLSDYKPDYILHLASISSVSQSWKEPVESFVNNTNIFLNLIDSVRILNLPTRILSVGSSEEYGNYPESKMPLKEEYELHPNSPYSIARVSQEMLSVLYAKSYNINVLVTRSFNHIGPKQRDVFVVPSFIKQLIAISKKEADKIEVGNIEIIRDFLDVRDVVDAYFKILTKGKVGEIYNVCSGQGIKLKTIIEKTSQILGIKPNIIVDKSKIRPADNMVIIGDNSKLKNELNWTPKYSLEQTVNDMINAKK